MNFILYCCNLLDFLKMAIIIILVITGCLFLFGCTVYNFDHGSTLANFQQKKFEAYKKNEQISEEDLNRLKNNLWVRTARKIAPGNLPIRQYCLIDLFEKKSRNKRKIEKMLDTLGENSLWKEGYSYWLYTKPFLVEYKSRFGDFGLFVDTMNIRFKQTAYKGHGGMIYPIPFGDIRKITLEDQDNSMVSDIDVFPVSKRIISEKVIEYYIKRCLVGLNTHIPKEDKVVRIIGNEIVCLYKDGNCFDYPWYEGYDKKYKNIFNELNDIFHKERINSLFAKKWWKEFEKMVKER